MSAPGSAERIAEAEAAAVAYQAALAKLGVAVLVEAVRLWQQVPPTQRATDATTWLASAVDMTMEQRRAAQALGKAYYRLVRALMTGTTIADSGATSAVTSVTLGELRRDFASLTGNTSARPPDGAQRPDNTTASPSVGSQAQSATDDTIASSHVDDDDAILLEELKELDRLEAEAEAKAREEALIDLASLGPDKLQKLAEQIDDQLPAQEADKLRQDAHTKAGARQAAAAERIAMNGARDATMLLQQVDKRAIAWARMSLTGTPCGWCAMLISRGAVYHSRRSATYDEEGKQWHDNCHCVAIPIFTKEQFESSHLFDLNRTYAEQWPIVTKGLGGKDALTAWRRFIRQEQEASTRRPAA